MHSTIAHHQLTDVQPLPKQWQSPSQLPVLLFSMMYGITIWAVWVSNLHCDPTQLLVTPLAFLLSGQHEKLRVFDCMQPCSATTKILVWYQYYAHPKSKTWHHTSLCEENWLSLNWNQNIHMYFNKSRSPLQMITRLIFGKTAYRTTLEWGGISTCILTRNLTPCAAVCRVTLQGLYLECVSMSLLGVFWSVWISQILGAAGVHSKPEHVHVPQKQRVCVHGGKPQIPREQGASDVHDLYLCEHMKVCVCV